MDTIDLAAAGGIELPHLKAKEPRLTRARPRLTAEDVGDYLDWITSNLNVIRREDVQLHMQACELVIRTRATDAQAKATQHTLVEQGIIEQPNA